MEGFIQELAGGILWLVANGVYVDARRKGTRGAHRFFGFWMGMPLTWLWMIAVPEGTQPTIAPPPDDDDALFAEVRRDRRLRSPEDGGDMDPGQEKGT